MVRKETIVICDNCRAVIDRREINLKTEREPSPEVGLRVEVNGRRGLNFCDVGCLAVYVEKEGI